jgi:hypothetical protein
MPRKPVPAIRSGTTLTCVETKKKFTANTSIPNFIIHPHDGVLSFDGLLARCHRDMRDRVGPYAVYLALNGQTVTNRLGAKLGDVSNEHATPSGRVAIRVKDFDGRWWYGMGTGRGRIVNLRPMADPKTMTPATQRRTRLMTLIANLEEAAAIEACSTGFAPETYERVEDARAALLDFFNESLPGRKRKETS